MCFPSWPDWPFEPFPRIPKKPTFTEAVAVIVREARRRIGCEDFVATFTLHPAEPDTSGRWPRANWDATPGEGADKWPPDCAEAFQETVLRNRGKFDIAWRR